MGHVSTLILSYNNFSYISKILAAYMSWTIGLVHQIFFRGLAHENYFRGLAHEFFFRGLAHEIIFRGLAHEGSWASWQRLGVHGPTYKCSWVCLQCTQILMFLNITLYPYKLNQFCHTALVI